jgi:hypothetical protein
VPIIPNATKYQELILFPEKKEAASAFFEVINEIAINTAKYKTNIDTISAVLILNFEG